MFVSLVKKIIGSRNDRQLKRMGKLVKKINAYEEQLAELDDCQLREKTGEFRERYEGGESLDALLPEAYAVVREASRRCMGMRHFDVQMIGGITLHEGRIAEMRTGEGKTLMATLPVYLNALAGKGVHVVTVNDYLARRDADWMSVLYEFLGLSVGVVVAQQSAEEKHSAYQADITYGTNNEFGFDYLRDNMAFRKEDKLQRPLFFAVVDEVDSILIDEARTPLIISGPAEDSSELYRQMNVLAPKLQRQTVEPAEGQTEKNSDPEFEEAEGHYTVDEKTRQVELTELGHQFVEEQLQLLGMLPEGESLYAAHNLSLLQHINSALRAHALFQKNVEYIVSGGEALLVDEHTGRTMPGRRLSDGLHQALEAKEGLAVQAESQTLASTTFQNYFRLYEKLSGMTGTADTEAFEFRQIYGLDVIVIPTHKPMIREDANDLVYLSLEEKYEAIIEDIRESVKKGRPVLVGTASIESSELLSMALKKASVDHKVLNAKFHEKEAEIIAQAGSPGAVTIATNMAGRGTDIILGGSWEAELAAVESPDSEQELSIREKWQQRHDAVLAAGGLHIIGTERHESRRIDNQLRGRAGRQGDPGSSRFYLSMEDGLMRIFASERVKNFMKVLGMEKGEAIEHRMVTNAIEKAQRKVEGRNFDIRKQLLEYDDVANDQRKVVYRQRDALLSSENVRDSIETIREEVVIGTVSEFIPPQSIEEQWDVSGLEARLKDDFAIELPIQQWLDEEDGLDEDGLRERVLVKVVEQYAEKEARLGENALQGVEKHILLRVLDDKWKEHLAMMDYLRQGIHLRGYAQKNPKQEYKREAFELFQSMLNEIKVDAIKILSRVEIRESDRSEEVEQMRRKNLAGKMQFQHASAQDSSSEPMSPAKPDTFVRSGRKVGRNDPCPCGSGKKYKQCHGKLG